MSQFLWCVLIVFLGGGKAQHIGPSNLELLFQWTEMEFAWPCEETRRQAIANGSYIPENNAVIGMEPYTDRIFLTISRWRLGVAASLVYVPITRNYYNNRSPVVYPYPNWAAHRVPQQGEQPQNHQLVSVFRVRVDSCNRLWVLDRGEENTLGSNPRQVRGPAIIIYNLRTNAQIRRHDLKSEHVNSNSFYANIVVDDGTGRCEDTHAYLLDIGSYSMIVYSFAADDSWRILHNFFYFDPIHCDFNIAGVNFQWTDGLFGAALGPVNSRTGYRTMYFHPMCSNYEFAVSTSVVQNQALATNSTRNFHLFHIVGYRGPNTQSTTSDIDIKTGVMFMTMLHKNGFACWNTGKAMNPDNVAIAAQDNETLIFTNEVRVGPRRYLYILSDRLSTFTFRTLNRQDYNYRIYVAHVDTLIKNTVCSNNESSDEEYSTSPYHF